MPFTTTWVNLEIFTLGEVSQSEKDKYHMISLIIAKSAWGQTEVSLWLKPYLTHFFLLLTIQPLGLLR